MAHRLVDGRGWQPYPFQQFILKVHGWCNLSCDYCYVYEMADRLWRDRPRGMPAATVEQTARRIGEHVGTHDLPAVNVVLHGGEPLLAGLDGIAHAVDAVRRAVPTEVDLTFRMQTNGTLLTDKMLDRMRDLEVRVGISLDGNRRGNGHRRWIDSSCETNRSKIPLMLRILSQPTPSPRQAGALEAAACGHESPTI
ncbi:radical SAM protein [Plantactinospora sp. CA-294935]|uniref:radical SAM protein n=1 Tax=Plantactinospora sp. CA-294935 TaxID=3240012 RepID=UPI003D93D72F